VSLSDESVSLPASSVADGVEFEETFPEAHAEPASAPAPAPVEAPARSRLLSQSPARSDAPAAPAAPRLSVVRPEPAANLPQPQPQPRQELAPRTREAIGDDVVTRVEEVLRAWQERFEQRLDQWRSEDLRNAQRAVTPAAPARSPLEDAIASAANVRDIARLMHRTVGETTKTAAFALAVHEDRREDVAYRYRVASDDEVGALLRREVLDDSAASAAAHADGWVRALRVVRAGTRNVTVHTAQIAVRAGASTIGVLTLQTEGAAVADAALGRIAELVQLAAPRLVELRDARSFRGA